MITIKTQSDFKNIKEVVKNVKKIGPVLTEQVLIDSNFYIPKDTGQLESSSLIHSNYDKGEVVWATPYAKKLYWNPQYNFSTDINPNARGLWFEAAKKKQLKNWVILSKEVLGI